MTTPIFQLIMASQEAGVAALQAGKKITSKADKAARAVLVEAGLGYGEAFRHRL